MKVRLLIVVPNHLGPRCLESTLFLAVRTRRANLQSDCLSVSSEFATDQYALGAPPGHRRPDFRSYGSACCTCLGTCQLLGRGRGRGKGKLASDQKENAAVKVHAEEMVGEAEEQVVASWRNNLLYRRPTITHRHPGGSRHNGAALL
ncbi:hypothetical protein E6C27_scaffold132G001260 [Cucumis melo var. makuwa]|uniref:Uncharacterized protein n=1 Tax=Cucumis melo var. makuwa TaxID=1194695 RepID=A0A5A7UUX7_CUCMM|nr:hypothetical protein E6C27_scaffold132G001260 [Cucumis melo var. makuwa]